jgi:hypothetical protein
MRGRAVLSILLLIAIAIVAPILMHARSRDTAASLVAFDDDPDMPVVLADAGGPVVAVVQRYVIIDLTATLVTAAPRSASILVMAPKTSPPLV